MTFMGSIYMVWFLIEEPPSMMHTSHVPLVCVPCEPCGSALAYKRTPTCQVDDQYTFYTRVPTHKIQTCTALSYS